MICVCPRSREVKKMRIELTVLSSVCLIAIAGFLPPAGQCEREAGSESSAYEGYPVLTGPGATVLGSDFLNIMPGVPPEQSRYNPPPPPPPHEVKAKISNYLWGSSKVTGREYYSGAERHPM